MTLVILADDMTGALDTAAPFARPDTPLAVGWRGAPLAPPSAFSTESRALPAADAVARLDAAFDGIPYGAAPFKKIDSLLRGNSLVEIHACQRRDRFRSIIVAAAFPSQERRMRDGWLHHPEGKVDAAAALTAQGARFRVVPRGAGDYGDGMVLCDAETAADMAAIVHHGRAAPEPRLWCGTAGLARALAGEPADRPTLPVPDLAVIGSESARSRADRDRVSAAPGVTAQIVTRPDMPPDSHALSVPGRRLLGFDLPRLSPVEAERIFRSALRALAAARPPEQAVLVVGGDTLGRLLDATEAKRLDVLGEWAPGVPVSRIVGGAWDGVALYSKSGSFTDNGLFDLFVQEDGVDAR